MFWEGRKTADAIWSWAGRKTADAIWSWAGRKTAAAVAREKLASNLFT